MITKKILYEGNEMVIWEVAEEISSSDEDFSTITYVPAGNISVSEMLGETMIVKYAYMERKKEGDGNGY